MLYKHEGREMTEREGLSYLSSTYISEQLKGGKRKKKNFLLYPFFIYLIVPMKTLASFIFLTVNGSPTPQKYEKEKTQWEPLFHFT